MRIMTFPGGIHPVYHKELSSMLPIEKAALPKRVIIPLSQHIGAVCSALVKKGDAVEEGQKIGDVKSFISAPVHASINGKVKDILMHPHPTGFRCLSIIIEGDGSEKDWKREAGYNIAELNTDELRSIIREAGIVGFGGASFPTSVKLTPPKEKIIDSVILNGCECEPYLSSDHRLMVEKPDKIILGLKVIMKTVGAKNGYIGIEDNKPDAINSLKGAVDKSGLPIKIMLLKTKYPQGAEKMLIKAMLYRTVPLGKLPLEVGVVVNNVGTAIAIHDAIAYKKPVIERVITISGGVLTPKNLLVRIGTSFEGLINQCGGIIKGKITEVISGGPMMGISQKMLDVPVIKGTSGITVLAGKKLKPLEYAPCIRCSRCVEACPMNLMPYRLGDFGRCAVIEGFKEWQGTACIECGCCSFVCPSGRPLVEWIRLGKIKLRSAESPPFKKGGNNALLEKEVKQSNG